MGILFAALIIAGVWLYIHEDNKEQNNKNK